MNRTQRKATTQAPKRVLVAAATTSQLFGSGSGLSCCSSNPHSPKSQTHCTRCQNPGLIPAKVGPEPSPRPPEPGTWDRRTLPGPTLAPDGCLCAALCQGQGQKVTEVPACWCRSGFVHVDPPKQKAMREVPRICKPLGMASATLPFACLGIGTRGGEMRRCPHQWRWRSMALAGCVFRLAVFAGMGKEEGCDPDCWECAWTNAPGWECGSDDQGGSERPSSCC